VNGRVAEFAVAALVGVAVAAANGAATSPRPAAPDRVRSVDGTNETEWLCAEYRMVVVGAAAVDTGAVGVERLDAE
jgi:hypothetical protein